MNRKEFRRRTRRYPFAYIAFWQLMVFALLICLIWISEILDLPTLYFGVAPEHADIFREWLLTAGVTVCAIIMIGNTYVQQRRIIQGLIMICSYCGKIEMEKDIWEGMQDYLAQHSLAAFSHGICPACYAKMETETGAEADQGQNG